jgi:hypothetical protein
VRRLLDAIAELVTRRRGPVLGAIALVTLAAGAWIPTLVADPTPQQLTASSIEDQAEISAAFNRRFGNPDHVVVLLVQADDVLDPEPLRYVHRLATTFRERDYVDRVEGITVTPLAIPVDEPDGGGATLDDLAGEDLESLDELETLDELEGGDPAGDPPVDPALEDALGALVRAAPEHFPMGTGSIANRLGAIRYGPAVEGEEVTAEDVARVRRAIAHAPLAEGRLISRDGTLTAVALMLDERVEDHRRMQRTVRDIDAVLEELDPPAGVTVTTGGLPHLFNSIVVKMEHDNFRIIPLTLLVCFVLLYLSFRWMPGTILPVAAVGISAVIVIGTMAMTGETMNVITNIVPPLLIIIGVSDSIHLIGRYREELERSATKIEAAKNTVRSMAVACFLTSITTGVGLASLVVSQTEMLQRFGVIAGIGVLIAYVVTIGFLPSAMTLFSPPLPPRKKRRPGPPPPAPAEEGVPRAGWGEGARIHDPSRNVKEWTADRGWLERSIVWLTAKILRRPWPFILGAVALMGLFVWGALRVTVDSALLDEFDPDDEAYTSTLLMEEKLEGVRPLEVMLEADEPGRMADPEVLAAIDETQAWLRAQDGVLSSVSATDYLRESWARVTGAPETRDEPLASREQVEALTLLFEQGERDPLDAYVAEEGRVGRIQVRLADIGAARSLVLIEALRERLDERFEPLGLRVSMVGEGYTGSLGLEAVVRDLLGSLSTAVLIIFGMLVVLFGSWRLGLLSIPPNVIPLVGTVAWMAMRGIPLNAATVIVFSISLGLAVDGSIHVLARYREEIGHGIGRNAALVRAAGGTGRAVVVSCVTLMLGFGVMLLSSFVPVRRFGELIGVTVGMCLLSTLIVQPALLRVAAPSVPPNRFRRRRAPGDGDRG